MGNCKGSSRLDSQPKFPIVWMPSVAPLRTADIAGLQGKRGNVSALPHNRRGKTLAVRLWHPLHILAGCDHNNKTATSRNARQEHPHNDGPKMSLAVTARSSEIICPPGAQEFHRRCKSNSGCILCDRPWNPRSATARSQSRANSSRNFRHHSGAEANILGIHTLCGTGTTASRPARFTDYLSLLLSHDLLLACTSATLIARNGKGATQT
jgi:hypothetical protein